MRVKETLISLAAAGLVVVVMIAAVVVMPGGLGWRAAAVESDATVGAKLPPGLVVKVDNVPQARPHTGLGAADAIYVEPVEGGFTRLAAVFWGRRPAALGPVRSARETDIELLGYLRRPVLAYSGASSQLEPLLSAADLVHATPKTASEAFYRIDEKPSPHNLYVRPRELAATKPVGPPLHTGPAPAGGRRIGSHHVAYRSASYAFTWSTGRNQWRVSMDGSPLISLEHGQLAANTVVIQRVRIVQGANIHDSAGHPSPVARTVGSGQVTVLRGGRAY
ncbi:MAG: DUF3048 domain-containing protein, partial [Thermocrispum sp.]